MLTEMYTLSFKKMHVEMSPGKRPRCVNGTWHVPMAANWPNSHHILILHEYSLSCHHYSPQRCRHRTERIDRYNNQSRGFGTSRDVAALVNRGRPRSRKWNKSNFPTCMTIQYSHPSPTPSYYSRTIHVSNSSPSSIFQMPTQREYKVTI